MSIQVKSGGTYKPSVNVFSKKSGVYTAVQGVFAKIAGNYQSVLAAGGQWATRGYSIGSPSFTEPGGLVGVAIPAAGLTLTSHMITELMTDATHVRMLMNNMSASRNRQIVGIDIVSVGTFGNGTTDLAVDAAFATPTHVTFDGGNLSTTVPFRTNAATKSHPWLKASDPIPLTMVARTDGGAAPIIAIREVSFYPGTDTAPVADQTVAYFSRDHATNSKWSTDQGKMYCVTVQGDKRGVALGATPNIGSGQTTILGFQYLAKGKVINTVLFGSSRAASQFGLSSNPAPSTDITKAANDKQNGGWFDKAVRSVSTPTHPIEFVQLGVPGQQIAKNVLALELLPVLQPTHVFTEFDNINNLSQGNSTEIGVLRDGFNQIITACKAQNPNVKIGGWASFTKNAGADAVNILLPYFTAPNDTIIKAWVTEASALCDYVINTRDGGMGDTASPQKLRMTANGESISVTFDGVHQTLGADVQILTPAAVTVLQSMATAYFA